MARHFIALVLTVAVAALAGVAAVVPQGQVPPPADLVLVNGKIATLEGPAEVTALAARRGRIVALGSDAEIKRHAGPATEVIDLRGQLAIRDSSKGTATSPG